MTTADEVRQAVESYLGRNTSVVSAVAAKELLDTELLPSTTRTWLWDRRYEIMAAYVTHVSKTRGARQAAEHRHKVFADASDELASLIDEAGETGDREPVTEFIRMWHCANMDGKPVRKRLSDMNKTEVQFAQNRASNNIRYYQRRQKFLGLVAGKLKAGQVVSDVFTEETLEALLDSIK